MKITNVRLYTQAAGVARQQQVEPWGGRWQAHTLVANPMSVYAAYAKSRAAWMGPGQETFAIEIETDAGLTGCAVNRGGGPFACAVIDQHLRRFLTGQSPFNIERIWDQMERSTLPYGLGGVVGMAMSGVDLALWDLLGRAMSQPVYNLLGGKVRDQIPCYVTTHPDCVQPWIERGFLGVKIAAPYGVESGRDGILKMEQLTANVRKTIGDHAELMIDCYASWSIEFAARLAERIRGYDVKWFEDPLPNGWAYESNRILRDRIAPISLANGNLEYHYRAFHQMLVQAATDVIQPEIQWCGGLTATRRIAAIAKAYDIPVIPHGASVYAYHFAISNVNTPCAEYLAVGDGRAIGPTCDAVIGEPIPDEGVVQLSDAPGFGVELNRDRLVPYKS